jgi:membrane protease YdiL (CAAX protease family)
MSSSAPQPRPFPLHPNFWWALLWCIGLILYTQIPAGLVAIAVVVIVALSNPNAVNDINSPAVQTAVGLAVVVAHTLIIVFSLLELRIVAGRDWKRQVGLRLPAGCHVLLILAAMPSFLILGSGSYHLIRHGLAFPNMDDPAGVAAFWAGISIALVVAGLGQMFLRVVLGAGWYRRLIEPASSASTAALSVGLLGLLVGVAWAGFVMLRPEMKRLLPERGALMGMEDIEEMFRNWPLATVVLGASVFPALSEELWCRAYLGRGLVGIHGRFWGVLLTSFLFGLIHIDPCQGTMAVVMGLVLHAVYLATRSLLAPMLVHFLFNALSVTLARIPEVVGVNVKVAEGKLPVPWHLLAAAALLLGASLWALYLSRARLVGAAGGPAWQPPYPGVAWPPPESSTRVWVPWPPMSAGLAVLAALGLIGLSLAGAMTFP